ncbi:hypothetical protein L1049_002004 [Liquidambar formosana]|uniref:Uncharacterized protein n=1 Tax=Liquidambar formosana TaxID=63359 RepID=A0AAP0NGC3_LIQFO
MEEVEKEEESKSKKVVAVMEGVASIALLPCGSISGHFIQLPHSICYGLHGTVSMWCSRGEDYRLIKLTIMDFNSKREQTVVVECRGHDAARFQNIDHGSWAMSNPYGRRGITSRHGTARHDEAGIEREMETSGWGLGPRVNNTLWASPHDQLKVVGM